MFLSSRDSPVIADPSCLSLKGVAMKLSWLCSLVVVIGACCCNASSTEASLILVNAKLWTENPAQPTAQAVALDGSRILAVGNNAAIRKLVGPDTRIIDLGGRLLLPGFNDSHVHFLIGGGSLITVHLGSANSQTEFKDASLNSPEPFPKVVASQWSLGSSTLESARSARAPVD